MSLETLGSESFWAFLKSSRWRLVSVSWQRLASLMRWRTGGQQEPYVMRLMCATAGEAAESQTDYDFGSIYKKLEVVQPSLRGPSPAYPFNSPLRRWKTEDGNSVFSKLYCWWDTLRYGALFLIFFSPLPFNYASLKRDTYSISYFLSFTPNFPPISPSCLSSFLLMFPPTRSESKKTKKNSNNILGPPVSL